MSRETLVQAYISALPFATLAIVADGQRCRIERGEPGEKGARVYFFKPSHIDLLLSAASLADGPIDQPQAVVALLLEKGA